MHGGQLRLRGLSSVKQAKSHVTSPPASSRTSMSQSSPRSAPRAASVPMRPTLWAGSSAFVTGPSAVVYESVNRAVRRRACTSRSWMRSAISRRLDRDRPSCASVRRAAASWSAMRCSGCGDRWEWARGLLNGCWTAVRAATALAAPLRSGRGRGRSSGAGSARPTHGMQRLERHRRGTQRRGTGR